MWSNIEYRTEQFEREHYKIFEGFLRVVNSFQLIEMIEWRQFVDLKYSFFRKFQVHNQILTYRFVSLLLSSISLQVRSNLWCSLLRFVPREGACEFNEQINREDRNDPAVQTRPLSLS